MSDCRALDEVVPLGREEVESLHLLGVLLDRERVYGTDGLERADDAGRLRLERLEIEVQQRRLLDELVERPVPLGLDSLDDAAAGARGLREPHLQAVALLAAGIERAPRRRDLALDAEKCGFGRGELGVGVGARGLELLHCDLPLRPALAPLSLLGCDRRGVGLEPGQLAGQGQAGALGLHPHRGGPLQPLVG